MKIAIKDKSNNGEIFVRGLVGKKNVEHQLDKINARIKNINKELARLYE